MSLKNHHVAPARIGRLMVQFVVMLVAASVLSACAETQFLASTFKRVGKDKAVYKNYKIGNPYQIKGVWYYPSENFEYDETGIASWYGSKFHGRKTANGEIFDMNEVSAAHKTLPLPSLVRVTNLENGRSLKLRINDRGPYARGRIIDLSRRASQLLGFQKNGTAQVRVTVLSGESRALAARLKGQTEIAQLGSPITVNKLPKAKVSAEALPSVDGAGEATPVSYSPPTNDDEAGRGEPQLASLPSDTSPTVRLEPVSATKIYIQAGAFSNFDNANRVHARLLSLGDVKISPVLVGGRDLFRVRVGPLGTVDDADQMLERVIGAGYTNARTIID
ncbi:MAG: septal ring lytic transglycosylase RlpA family protein [Alphaproteobacteria bacterium]